MTTTKFMIPTHSGMAVIAYLHGDDCCSTLGAPWFYYDFIEPEGGAVEVRICCDEVYSNEATLLEKVALYIQ